jgi:hypothetical protein
MPNTKMVGVSKRKMAAASAHFGPRTTRTMSSANKAQKMEMGTVIEMTRE